MFMPGIGTGEPKFSLIGICATLFEQSQTNPKETLEISLTNQRRRS